jgi:hypothetical protein
MAEARGFTGILVSGIGVRARSNDIGGAGIGGHMQHVEGLLESCGAIINAPEDVAMDVDHSASKEEKQLLNRHSWFQGFQSVAQGSGAEINLCWAVTC